MADPSQIHPRASSPWGSEPGEEKSKVSKKKSLRALFRHVSGSKHQSRNDQQRLEPGHLQISPSPTPRPNQSSPISPGPPSISVQKHHFVYSPHTEPRSVSKVEPSGESQASTSTTRSTRSSSLSDRDLKAIGMTDVELQEPPHSLDSPRSRTASSIEHAQLTVVESRKRRQPEASCPTKAEGDSIHSPDWHSRRDSEQTVPSTEAAEATRPTPNYWRDSRSSTQSSRSLSPTAKMTTTVMNPTGSSPGSNYPPNPDHSPVQFDLTELPINPKMPETDPEPHDIQDGNVIETNLVEPNTTDTTLTQVQLSRLNHDISQLESALRKNTHAQNELENWLFEQMAVGNMIYNDPSSLQTSVNGESDGNIKRMYEEQARVLKQQAKALKDQLQATRYVIAQLELQGIPVGVSPKTYVRQLLKDRGKSHSGQPPTKPGVIEPMPSTLVSETNPNRNPSEPTLPFPMRNERLVPVRSAHTLPATHPHPPGGSPRHERQAKTMPPASDYLTAPLSKRPSNSSFKSTALQDMVSPPWNDLKTVVSSASLLAQALEPSNQPVQFPANARYTGSPHASMLSYPTSPEALANVSEEYGEQSAKSGSRIYQVATNKLQPIHSGNVLHSMRQGLENFGRQLRLTGRTRSASAEHLPSTNHDYQGPLPPDREAKSSRTWSRSVWPSSASKRSKRTARANAQLNHAVLQSPERSATMDSRVPSKNRSQTDSISSTGGHLTVPLLCGAEGTGSVTGLSGMTPFKVPPTESDAGVAINLLSEDANECTLARILELLGSTSGLAVPPSTLGNAAATGNDHPTRVGSSGSSISASAQPSNGQKSAALDGQHALSVSQQHIAPHSLLLTNSGSGSTSSTYRVALAFTMFYRLHNAQLAALKVQQAQAIQDQREEFSALRRENLELQTAVNNLTAELGAIRRDAHTREELQKQKLANATARIEQLDANAEQSRQSLQRDLVSWRNEFRDGFDSLEYQLTKITRDLSDNIATVSNRVSILEKPSEPGSASGVNGSEWSRIRHKVLHYLTDMCVSLFALLTMLLQVLIRCLNMGAVVTENRTLAIFFSVLLASGIMLVYISDPLIHVLNDRDVRNNTSSSWRDVAIGFLSIFRRSRSPS